MVKEMGKNDRMGLSDFGRSGKTEEIWAKPWRSEMDSSWDTLRKIDGCRHIIGEREWHGIER